MTTETKTVIDLMREYVRVSDMCDAYNRTHLGLTGLEELMPWECVKLGNDQMEHHPTFDFQVESYTFAVAIIEGRPVFVGDVLYCHKFPKTSYKALSSGLGSSSISTITPWEYVNYDAVTWTPPTKKRTFILELNEREIDFLTDLIDPSFYGCDPSVHSIRLKAQSLLTAARDKG